MVSAGLLAFSWSVVLLSLAKNLTKGWPKSLSSTCRANLRMSLLTALHWRGCIAVSHCIGACSQCALRQHYCSTIRAQQQSRALTFLYPVVRTSWNVLVQFFTRRLMRCPQGRPPGPLVMLEMPT